MGQHDDQGSDTTAKHRRWTADEDDQLRHLISQGWSTRRIAGVLRRPIDGVYRRAAHRYGGIDALRHELFAVRSGREMLTLMGIQQHTLKLWIARGWLRAHRGYGRKSRNTARLRLLVSDDALDAFLAIRDAWVTWEPGQMTDADWRARAEEVRAKAHGRWVRTDTLAREMGVSLRTAQSWVRLWETTRTRSVLKVAERWHVWVANDDSIDVLRAQHRAMAQQRTQVAGTKTGGIEERPMDSVHGDGTSDDQSIRPAEGAGG